MTGPRTPRLPGIRPGELGEAGSVDPIDVADALASGRWLETSIDDVPARAGAAFTDRVMLAIADEPTPSRMGFLAPIRRRGFLAGFAGSVRQAWASVGTSGRPAFGKATALAYVLAVAVAGASITGVATIGVAGALGLLDPRPTETAPPTTTPAPTIAPVPSPLPSPESAPPSSPPPSPSESPDESDDDGGGGSEPSDDHGGSSSSGSSEDSSGSDEAGSTETPDPTDTPRPTGTLKPTQTPH